MTFTKQVENTAVGGLSTIPTVSAGIGLGILISIVPVVIMAVGLKLTNEVFMRVVD